MMGLPPISSIARDLGAPAIKDDRCAAWYRGGNNPRSLKLDDAKACVYDFGKQEGGGILWLVSKALSGDRHESVEWLRTQYGTSRPNSAQRQQRYQVDATAESLAAWRWRVIQFLRAVRNASYEAWNEAQTRYRGDKRVEDLPASDWRMLRRRLKHADGIDSYIKHLADLPAAELLALRDRVEGSRAA